MPVNAEFFNTVRPVFQGRKLTQGQVDGMNRIVAYGEKWAYKTEDTAFVLGQVFHEVNQWMQPIREGASRIGPGYSDLSAKRAVASLYNRGLIRTNYALPAGPHKQSYYGRGLIQITWYDNYLKFERILGIPLTANPDLALDFDVSLDIAFIGCRDGVFRNKKMAQYEFPQDYRAARDIVNGDVTKNGSMIAGYCNTFLNGLYRGGYRAN